MSEERVEVDQAILEAVKILYLFVLNNSVIKIVDLCDVYCQFRLPLLVH